MIAYIATKPIEKMPNMTFVSAMTYGNNPNAAPILPTNHIRACISPKNVKPINAKIHTNGHHVNVTSTGSSMQNGNVGEQIEAAV